ncbi:MAG: glycosyltransferase family 4 protein [Candidatus Coatesbacteria bacterium]|nr:glycosyltransferase family 4 protein [Candidatus Coatesbacteria bacterium]
MRLIYVHEATLPEAKARTIQAINTVCQLAKLGAEVRLLVDSVGAEERDKIGEFYGLELPENMEIIAEKDMDAAVVARKAIAKIELKDAFVYCRNLRIAQSLLPTCRGSGVPLIYEAHKVAFMVVSDEARLSELPPGRARRRAMRTFKSESEVFDKARGIVCTTDATAALARTMFGREQNMIVARNGGPEPLKASEVEGAEGIGEVPKLIVYVGSLGGWKGTDTLFEALKILDGFKLEIAGSISGGTAIRRSELMDQYSLLEGSLALKGHLPPGEVMDFLSSKRFAAAVISIPAGHSIEPYLFTCPLKLFQYLAAGIPVVASDVPALREILRHRENAVLVEPENPEALAEGIRMVYSNRELRKNIIRSGLETAAHFTYRKRAERILSLLETIAGSR